MKIKKTMKSQITILLFLAVIIPTTIISSLSYYINNKGLKEKFDNDMVNQTSNVSSILNDIIKYNKEIINMLSENSDAKDIQAHPEYEGRMMSYFYECRDSHKDIITIYYGESTGKHHATVDKIPDGFDPRTRPWYKNALSNQGKVIITEPYEDVNKKGRYVITLAKNVKSKAGQLAGVAGIDITLDDLSERVSKINIGKNGFTTIIDNTGNIIACKDKTLVGKNSKEEKWIDELIQNKSKDKITQIKGEKYITYTMKNEETGYTVAAFVPEIEFNQAVQKIRNTMVLIIIVLLIVSLLVGNYTGIRFSKSIEKMVQAIKHLGTGDFSLKIVNNKDDVEELKTIGDSLNFMIEDMQVVIKNIKESSEQLQDASANMAAITEESNAASEEVAKVVQSISESASEQSTGLENTEGLTISLNKEIDNTIMKSKKINEASKNVKEAADEGILAINTLRENYSKNLEANDTLLENVKVLAKSSKEILTITDALKGITEQTNLLALNASIEAARAGEHGKGFAVVADEVRKLAEESSNSAYEINNVLTNMENNMKIVLEGINQSKNLNNLTGNSLEVTNTSFNNIIEELKALTENISDMYLSLNKVDLNKVEVVKNVSDVAVLAQDIAAATEEASASSEEQNSGIEQIANFAETLVELAMKLEEDARKFKI
ncbi:methyl-accepting chemotaxis protein [Clostridium sp. MB40-C1]|uniref:methyl-accepting chemotaxis protein n=1 Tax=Clostridium sp. MB40-C1 TaxID=3070996 RepID=UPI0027E1B812|nr:methyl-accepting chemotaxis protein [Clostridium sp. MB40-C1]WMJ80221.1 methyl-accepting chemotaxis protein [Clostridium sp. MB40-C1]